MNSTFQTVILTATACVSLGLAAAVAGPAASATAAPIVTKMVAHPNSEQRLIVANQTNHDLDMTITLGGGGTIHQVVPANSGWYPDGDYVDNNRIIVKDGQGLAFTGTFSYRGDWVAGQVTTTPRLRYTWHTGTFGGYDFR